MPSSAVVLDTNVLVAAGFNPRSASAKIVEAVKQGELRMVWNEATRRRSNASCSKFPRSGHTTCRAFSSRGSLHAPTHPQRFAHIPDPDDRKFAALAHATDAKLISNDDHLLRHRDRMDVTVLTPMSFGTVINARTMPKGGHDPAIWMHQRRHACVTTPDSGRGTQRRATAPGACVLCMRSCVGVKVP